MAHTIGLNEIRALRDHADLLSDLLVQGLSTPVPPVPEFWARVASAARDIVVIAAVLAQEAEDMAGAMVKLD